MELWMDFPPEVYGARDCKKPLDNNRELNDVEREYSQRPPELGVSKEFLTIARAAVGDLNLQYPPRNREEGTELFAAITIRVKGLSGVIFSCYLECRGCHEALLVLPCSANVV
ncbi:hypothetical protein DPMN_070005 [Dreissena polymorpha]|uniref:Uncharacterized protein n=1 Tax=Dreissena polymorpha TaxID=45954 RepID=A0A9D4BNK2_DREPO|nr:hypothetical protein DPMN_070005 [Dreissena polymorpha]